MEQTIAHDNVEGVIVTGSPDTVPDDDEIDDHDDEVLLKEKQLQHHQHEETTTATTTTSTTTTEGHLSPHQEVDNIHEAIVANESPTTNGVVMPETETELAETNNNANNNTTNNNNKDEEEDDDDDDEEEDAINESSVSGNKPNNTIPVLFEPLQPHEPWSSVWTKLKDSGWTWTRAGPEGYFWVKPGCSGRKGEEGKDYFASQNDLKEFVKKYYMWTGEAPIPAPPAATTPLPPPPKTTTTTTTTTSKRLWTRRKATTPVPSIGGGAVQESNGVLKQHQQPKKLRFNNNNGNDESLVMNGDATTTTTTPLAVRTLLPTVDEFSFPIPPLKEAVLPHDFWSVVDRKLQFSGWSRYQCFSSNYVFVKPGCSFRKGKAFQDYLPSEEHMKKYAVAYYGWLGDESGKIAANNNREANTGKRYARRSPPATPQLPPPEAEAVNDTPPLKRKLNSSDSWTCVWDKLRDSGWKLQHSDGFTFFLKPGKSVKNGRWGVDYFVSEDEIMTFVTKTYKWKRPLEQNVGEEQRGIVTADSTTTTPEVGAGRRNDGNNDEDGSGEAILRTRSRGRGRSNQMERKTPQSPARGAGPVVKNRITNVEPKRRESKRIQARAARLGDKEDTTTYDVVEKVRTPKRARPSPPQQQQTTEKNSSSTTPATTETPQHTTPPPQQKNNTSHHHNIERETKKSKVENTSCVAVTQTRTIPLVSGPLQAHCIRLPPGSDLVPALLGCARQAMAKVNSKSAIVLTAVGSLEAVSLRMASACRTNNNNDTSNNHNQDIKTWTNQRFEVVSLVGSFAPNDAKHLHMSVSDGEGNVYGGHLIAGTVFTTLELVLGTIGGVTFSREHDIQTGYSELIVSKNDNNNNNN
eukprot:CAMPEP_0118713494 /NCGR_PEP_ID=MMETSP0800-20121206/25548_1 /TAXON_ID=210618 ORGANISM="Striatella unipunctata, Strain CCMP2910" /NCGR_SAMPLE_ID=MMETSP0800 /ASSEMBLY_ACC=CAM_ASM_000638 /LENGTH=861 /DNA_ID=CAMNT_0006618953 /DNA_START=223 /DNA_END=2808 /DNA_ORIENTATION=+